MRSLISIGSPAPQMEPESAHVVSAVSVHWRSTTLWLMAAGKATREAFLSEAGFEKVFRTQNWVRRSKLFCR